MLMDEFAAPGRIGIIDKSNAYMAGYGMRLLTIIQSLSQIEAEPRRGYGREGAGTLITNHACQILYTPRKQSDANEYSEMLDYFTFKAKGISRQLGGKGNGVYTDSESDQKRALMLPQELKQMSQREQIISLENTKPIKCEKIAYYADHVFIDRLKSVCPTLAALDHTLFRRFLRKIGIATKAKPSKKLLESTWGAGELASYVPLLNFDLHDAIVQERSRPMTTADIAKGIDLRTLALDTSKIPIPEGAGIEPDQIEAFVNGFFDALDAGNEYDEDFDEDGTSERPSDDELAALDAQAAEETPESPHHVEQSEQNIEQDELLDLDPVEEGPTDEELAAMMDDFEFEPADDAMFDEAEMLAAFENMEAEPEYPEDLSSNTPILDLSILDKPSIMDKNAN